jgi:hypothetical protein
MKNSPQTSWIFKGRIVFLILMFWPVFRIKSSALFLDEDIYIEFQALCQVNIGNKKKEVNETLSTLSVLINMAPQNRNFTYFFKIVQYK